MNTFSDETLMAFADDELDPTTRAAVAAAMRDDPEIERRVARHRALRARIRLAYSAELQQPSPERLLAAARGRGPKPKATVTDLAAVRAASAANAANADNAASTAGAVNTTASRPGWWPAAAMAASLLIGVAVGYFALHRADPLVARDGGWVAGGELAGALSNQVGAEYASGNAVQTTLSFVSKSGDYCRVFSLTGASAAGGIACRQGDSWRIRMLTEDGPRSAADGGAAGTYRTAGSALSPAVLAAVQSQIAGAPLDRDGEMRAREQGWRALHR
jgi:hypothetical protein